MQVLRYLRVFSRLSSYHLSSIVKKREYRVCVRHIIKGGGSLLLTLAPGRGKFTYFRLHKKWMLRSTLRGWPGLQMTGLVQWSLFQVMQKWQTKFRSVFQSNAKTKNEEQNSYPFFKVMRKRKTKHEVQNRFSKLGENEKQKAKFKSVFQCHAKTKNGNGTWIPFSHAIEKRLALRYTHSEFLFLPKPSNVIINYSQSNGKTSLQENHPQNRVIYLFSSRQITPPQKPTICCANLTAFPYCFTNQAQVFQIVWAGKMYKLIFSIIKSSRGHIMNPLFGQDGWILASFFLAFLVTSSFSRSKIKRAWPMPNHLDFTFDQKPLFLFFPSSSSLPFFFSFWQRCLKSGSIYPVCWECTSSWAVG